MNDLFEKLLEATDFDSSIVGKSWDEYLDHLGLESEYSEKPEPEKIKRIQDVIIQWSTLLFDYDEIHALLCKHLGYKKRLRDDEALQIWSDFAEYVQDEGREDGVIPTYNDMVRIITKEDRFSEI